MTGAQYAGLSSAVLGAVGTAILFFNSYALEPFEGGVFGSDEITEYNNQIKIRNFKRLCWQRVGLAFLGLGFFIQFISYFL